jgi:hypothetical protein
MCNTYYFSTSTKVALTRLIVALYVSRLTCSNRGGECLLRGTHYSYVKQTRVVLEGLIKAKHIANKVTDL